MSLSSRIDVPSVCQEDDFSCVPVCIKMILDFVREKNKGVIIPSLDLDTISNRIDTGIDGTPLDSVEKVNSLLTKAVPSIEFEVSENCTFEDLEDEIRKGNPIIAWIKKPHPHSIVVTGLDSPNLRVFCNDPEIGKTKIETGKFLKEWNAIGNILIKVKIGEKIQRHLPEYPTR